MATIPINQVQHRKCIQCEQNFYQERGTLACPDGHVLLHQECCAFVRTLCPLPDCRKPLEALSNVGHSPIQCPHCFEPIYTSQDLKSCNRNHVIYHAACLDSSGQTLCSINNCGNPEISDSFVDLSESAPLPKGNSTEITSTQLADRQESPKITPTAPLPFPTLNIPLICWTIVLLAPLLLISSLIIEGMNWTTFGDYSQLFRNIARAECSRPKHHAQLNSYYYQHFKSNADANEILLRNLKASDQETYIGALRICRVESSHTKSIWLRQRGLVKSLLLSRLRAKNTVPRAKAETLITFLTLSEDLQQSEQIFATLTPELQNHVIVTLCALNAAKPMHGLLLLELKAFDPDSFHGPLVKKLLLNQSLNFSQVTLHPQMNIEVLTLLVRSRVEELFLGESRPQFNQFARRLTATKSTSALLNKLSRRPALFNAVATKIRADPEYVYKILCLCGAGNTLPRGARSIPDLLLKLFRFNDLPYHRIAIARINYTRLNSQNDFFNKVANLNETGQRISDELLLYLRQHPYQLGVAEQQLGSLPQIRKLKKSINLDVHYDVKKWESERVLKFYSTPPHSNRNNLTWTHNRTESLTKDKKLLHALIAANRHHWLESTNIRPVLSRLANDQYQPFTIQNAQVPNGHASHQLASAFKSEAALELLSLLGDWGPIHEAWRFENSPLVTLMLLCREEWQYEYFLNALIDRFSTKRKLDSPRFEAAIDLAFKEKPIQLKRALLALAKRTASLYWLGLLGRTNALNLESLNLKPEAIKISRHLHSKSVLPERLLIAMFEHNNIAGNTEYFNTPRYDFAKYLSRHPGIWKKLVTHPKNQPDSQFARNVAFMTPLVQRKH